MGRFVLFLFLLIPLCWGYSLCKWLEGIKKLISPCMLTNEFLYTQACIITKLFVGYANRPVVATGVLSAQHLNSHEYIALSIKH